MTLDDLAHTLERLANVIEDPPLQPYVEEVRDDLAAATYKNFEEQHDPDGVAWPATRGSLRPPDRTLILVKTGALELTAVEQLASAPADHQGFCTNPGAWGPEYGKYQYGPPFSNDDRIDPRPFTGWGEHSADSAAEKLADGLVRILEEEVARP